MKTVDQYIIELEKWQDEVQLLRGIILATGLTETIKWGTPTFMLEGKNVVSIAAFKSYVGVWFFQGGLLQDEAKLLHHAQEGTTKSMLQWRFYTIEQIAESPVSEYILESISCFERGLTIKKASKSQPILTIPSHLQDVLSADAILHQKWDTLSPACKREYAAYINEAKKEETQLKRIEKILPMILQSKGLNDKYKK